MPANKRSASLTQTAEAADLTSIPKSRKSGKVQKNQAKSQQATAKLEKLTTTKRKELYKEIKQKDVITNATSAVTGEVLRGKGRPTKYTQEIANTICAGIAMGMSLRRVLGYGPHGEAPIDSDLPGMTTVWEWLRTNEDFQKQYTRAKAESADALVDEMLDIVDDGHNDWMEANYGGNEVWITNGEALQRSRLRFEARKWMAAKLKPKAYGDKLDLTSDGKAIPLPMLGGASADANLINDMKPAQIPGEVSENAGN